MYNQSQNHVSELQELFRKYFFEDNSFIRRIQAKSKTFYTSEGRYGGGFAAWACPGDIVLEFHSDSNECPGLIINCNEVESVFFDFRLPFSPFIEQDSFGIRLYLHDKEFGAIKCKLLSYEILDNSCWGQKEDDIL